MYFGRNFINNRAYHSYDEGVYIKKRMVFEDFFARIFVDPQIVENITNIASWVRMNIKKHRFTT